MRRHVSMSKNGSLTLQYSPFRYLHDCSGCLRLERLPGGACTHWNAPSFHGARQGSVIANHHEIKLVPPDVRAPSLFRVKSRPIGPQPCLALAAGMPVG